MIWIFDVFAVSFGYIIMILVNNWLDLVSVMTSM